MRFVRGLLCILCAFTSIQVFGQAPTVVITATDTNICHNGTVGVAVASVTGGTAPYSYLWDGNANSQTDSTATGLAVGSYTLTVTDAVSQVTTQTIAIGGPATMAITITEINPDCYGDADGSAAAVTTGGTSPYTYLWSNTSTPSNIGGLSGGSFSVTASDANSCTDTASVTIVEPDSITLAVTNTPVTCFNGADGTASATSVGGTGPYTYTWNNSATDSTITGLGAITYSVTVADNNNCKQNGSTTLTEPTPVSASVTDNDITCPGGSTGSASVTATGGATPYTYTWSSGGTDASVSGLTAGSYSVTVTDSSSCTDTTNFVISEPTAFSITVTPTDVSCYNGSDGEAAATSTGGTGTHSYSWSNGDTGTPATGLSAGTYTLTVTDDSSCTDTASVTISEPAELSATVTGTDVSCFGENDGTAASTVTGGTTAYSYAWSNGQTDGTATGLGEGSYTLTVTDSKSCSDTATVTINEPTQLLVTATSENVTCPSGSDGSATATGSGGTTAYSYAWSNGTSGATASNLSAGTYTVTITDARSCDTTTSVTITEPEELVVTTSSTNVYCGQSGTATATVTGGTSAYSYLWENGQFAETATGFNNGVYGVTVTDANNCEKTETVVVSETLCEEQITPDAVFSPNGDGINDTWSMQYTEWFPEMELSVYNRWGARIHHQQGTYERWDGKVAGVPVPTAVYYWVIVPDKTNKELPIRTGSVTIVQ